MTKFWILILFNLALCALRLQAMTSELEACHNPWQSSIYDDARHLFIRFYAELRQNSDWPEAVQLHEIILNGFDEQRANALGDPILLQRLSRAKIGQRQLTALHVAAIMGDIGALEWLVKFKADINALDKTNFAPAHFAALLENRDILDFFREQKADLTLVNAFGGTPESVWMSTHLRPPKKQAVYMHLPAFEAGPTKYKDAHPFCSLSQTYFVEGIKQTPSVVLKAWRADAIAVELPVAYSLTSRVEKFRPFPGDVYVKLMRRPTFFKDNFTADDFKLHANRAFAMGDVVELYATEWESDNHQHPVHILNIQLNKFRGYGTFASDNGLPNVTVVQFFNRLGIPQGHFLLAIRPIKAGDMIVRERFTMETVPDVHVESDPKALDELLAQTSLEELARSYTEKTDSRELVDVRNRAIALYLKSNVIVLLRLVAEKKISMPQLRHFAAKMRIVFHNPQAPADLNWFDVILVFLEKHLENKDYRKFFARKARSGMMQVITHVITNLLIETKHLSQAQLEQLWLKTHLNYCADKQNANLLTCAASHDGASQATREL